MKSLYLTWQASFTMSKILLLLLDEAMTPSKYSRKSINPLFSYEKLWELINKKQQEELKKIGKEANSFKYLEFTKVNTGETES